ncbi:Uncharacterized [Syntrophomonas zehnderi OL-4]|jgi:hypothetical protein|uniref:Uncharacterized n=1 Tax=Syntrophomonas zehnderi OL-4 TaxID=690567 RepID=A0A0E4C9E1_9FIRM|nr:Uncharacterized [Syntrophomonas zehnderi OL-4]
MAALSMICGVYCQYKINLRGKLYIDNVIQKCYDKFTWEVKR